jgi:integrase
MRGAGEVLLRGAIYHVRYYDRNGRQRVESTRQGDPDEAKRILAERIAAIKNGVPVTPQIARLTLEAAAALVEADYELKDNRSLAHVQRHLTTLKNYFGRTRRMTAITAADIDQFAVTRKREGYTLASINREKAALRRAFKLAIRKGLLLVAPYIETPKEDNARRGFFEYAEFAAVRAALPPDLQVVATLAYYTGWRLKAEILPMEWSWVDRAACTITLPAACSKNKRPRVYAYGELPELVAAIAACWREHERIEKTHQKVTARVFVRWTGKKRTGKPVKSWRKAWRIACTAANQEGQIPHNFRRTASRNLRRRGVQAGERMALIGHLTDSMDRRYAIVDEADLAAAAGRLADLATEGAGGPDPGANKIKNKITGGSRGLTADGRQRLRLVK